MKWWFCILIILAAVILPGQAFAVSGPQVVNRDGRISISADHVTLRVLLSLWDQATGMRSTAPPELAGKKLSVHFAGLSEVDAVRAIFHGQPFGYAFAQGQGIVVTSALSGVAEDQPKPPPAAGNVQNTVPRPDLGGTQTIPEVQNPAIRRMKPQDLAPDQPVTVTPSPFGPIVSPEGRQPPLVQLPPVPGAPLPPPFFQPDVPVNTPSGSPYGPGHDMLFAPLSVHP